MPHDVRLPLWLTLTVLLTGCGTTRWSDTSRTGTEQLLLSTAVDQSINNIDFTPLAGHAVFFDDQYVKGATDANYIISSLRQHMLAYGCILKEKREDAELIVEARAGAMGTNRHDLMLGVPAMNLPNMSVPGSPVTAIPSVIPEVAVAKTTDQKGVAKIAVFAYHRESGSAVWQSGVFPVATNAKDSWILGMGPFQKGTIYNGTRFAGSKLIFSGSKSDDSLVKPPVPVSAEAVFGERPAVAAKSKGELSAVGPPAGAPGEAAPQQAAVQQAAAPAPPAEVVQAHVPDDAPEQDANAAPAVQIKRLPPVERAARPDLRVASAPSDRKETTDDTRPDEDDDHPSRLRLLDPRNWFGDDKPVAAEPAD